MDQLVQSHLRELNFDLRSDASAEQAADILQQLSSTLARDEVARIAFGQATNPLVWRMLDLLWDFLADRSESISEPQARILCLRAAQFTRNLVAGVPLNQSEAFKYEPAMRRAIHRYTSYSVMQDERSHHVTTMLVQALSNIITANEPLSQQLWQRYMNLSPEDSIMIRLLTFPEPSAASATFVLLLNLLRNSQERAVSLVTTQTGRSICISLLDRVLSLSEAAEEGPEKSVFDIGYVIYTRLLEWGLVPRMYDVSAVAGETIAPHQTVILKMLDSYLLNQEGLDPEHAGEILRMVTSLLFDFSSYVQGALERAFGPAATDGKTGEASTPPVSSTSVELDVALVAICEGLVLALQCMISMLLRAESQPEFITLPSGLSAKGYVLQAGTPSGKKSVEEIVETLRGLDTYLPRVTYGKVANPPSIPGQPAQTASEASPPPVFFSYLKRDFVRVLGILCTNDRSAQDRVRECGGIPIVMNMCVVDDQNPYLREHAIFALRNLLHQNNENQAVVHAIQPVAKWDHNGALQSIHSDEQSSGHV